MNKFSIALLPLAVIGFVVAAPTGTNVDDYKIRFGSDLFQAASTVDIDDSAAVNNLRAAYVDAYEQWAPVKSTEVLETKYEYPAGDEYAKDLANMIGSIAVVTAYKGGDKYSPVSGTKSKGTWMNLMMHSVVEPCERVVEQLKSAVDPIRKSEWSGFKVNFDGQAENWIQSFELCERVINEPMTFISMSYEVAEKNDMLH